MSEQLELDYRLTGAGWAQCVLHLHKKEVRLRASYLSDALGSLATATLALCAGQRQAYFSWDDEPGEHLWLLTRFEDEEEEFPQRLFVRILSDTAVVRLFAPFPEMVQKWRDYGMEFEALEDGSVIAPEPQDGLDSVVFLDLPFHDFVGHVVQVLDRVWAEHGAEGYFKEWALGQERLAFPEATHRSLALWHRLNAPGVDIRDPEQFERIYDVVGMRSKVEQGAARFLGDRLKGFHHEVRFDPDLGDTHFLDVDVLVHGFEDDVEGFLDLEESLMKHLDQHIANFYDLPVLVSMHRGDSPRSRAARKAAS